MLKGKSGFFCLTLFNYLVINRQITWLNYVLVLWKVEIVRSEVEYFAKEMSKQSVEGSARVSLLFIVICER